MPAGKQIGLPKDIPCVLAIAGVDQSRIQLPFSSEGPCYWEGVQFFSDYSKQRPLQKPDLTAFPSGYPVWNVSGSQDIRKGWREVKPEPWHKTANNWVGQIFGLVHKVPGVLKGMYSQFSKDYSDTQILFMALSVPVVSGMLLIWVADAITVRRTVSRSRRYVAEQELIRRRAAQAAAHPHAE